MVQGIARSVGNEVVRMSGDGVRLRSLLLLMIGAVLGAGAMYLLDPEQGAARRREARRTAVREGFRGAVRLGRRVLTQLGAVVDAAVQGFVEGRDEAGPPPADGMR